MAAKTRKQRARRAGRPRGSGSGRWDANRNRKPDLGTDELRAKRLLWARGADPESATHPLDLMAARGLLQRPGETPEDAEARLKAGQLFEIAYRYVIGRHHPVAADLDRFRIGGTAMTGVQPQFLDRMYSFARHFLSRRNRSVRVSVMEIVVKGEWPKWLHNHEDFHERRGAAVLLEFLVDGLDALVEAREAAQQVMKEPKESAAKGGGV